MRCFPRKRIGAIPAAVLCLFAFVAGALPAAELAAAESASPFAEFTPLIQEQVDRLGLPGAVFLVVRGDEVLYEGTFGGYTMDTVIPIKSASKWITVGVVMSLVDDGLLSLDDPVSKYLPEFRDGAKAKITIRQTLSCTSGMTERIRDMYRPDIEFDAAVQAIARTPLKAEPGTELIYGGTGFHVAGRVAEVVSGEGWHTLFRERIAEPLGLKDSVYGRRDRKRIIPEPARNPWLGGGLVTSVEGYSRFVQMLLNQGVYEGRRVLSAESVREMRIDQSRNAKITSTLHPDKDTHYTLGAWVERVAPDGEARQIRDMGAGGFNPWVDYERGYYAIFAIDDKLGRVWSLTKDLEARIQRYIDSGNTGGPSVSRTSAVAPAPTVRATEKSPVSRALVAAGEKRSLNLTVGGTRRTATIYVPSAYRKGTSVPLLLALHPGGAEGSDMIERTGWDLTAEQKGFIAAFPDATSIASNRNGRKRDMSLWNDGSGRRDDDVDDSAFLAALIDEIAGKYSIDRDRVYITGFGAGASMTFRAGVDLSDRIAAIAPVSGQLWDDNPRLKAPVSVISILGSEDHVNPIKEGLTRQTSVTGVTKPQLRSSLQRWARALGLAPESDLRYISQDVFRERWGPGEKGAEVVFYIVEGLGHTWPGSDAQGRSRREVPTSDALDANAVIWDFFSRHRANGRR